MVICLEQGADLHMAQLMPLPLTVSCFSKIQIGFIFLVLAHPGSPGKGVVKWVCVCVTTYSVHIHHCVSADVDLMQVKLSSQQQRVSKKTSQRPDSSSSNGGVVYPIDLWFLIGSYIAPEDVCTFASICRGTHVVTHSARFWLSLYRRSYTLIILLTCSVVYC